MFQIALHRQANLIHQVGRTLAVMGALILPYSRVKIIRCHGLGQMDFLHLQRRTRSHNKNIEIVPNPFSDKIQIMINNLEIRGNISLTIYSSNGEILRELTQVNNNQFIDLGDLASGLYFVELSDKDSTINRIKIVKQ